MHLKGSKKAQQKRNFITKGVVTSKKAILDKKKKSHQRLLESPESDVFRFLDF